MKTVGQKHRVVQGRGRQARLQPARGKRRLGVRGRSPSSRSPASGRSSTSTRRTSRSCARPRSSASPSSRRTSPTATPSCSAARPTTSSPSSGWRRDHKDLDEPQPLAVRRRHRLAGRPARRARREGRRGAARDVRRRPRQRDPARVGQQPERRPQSGGNPADPRRPADRRAVPVQSRGRRQHALTTAARWAARRRRGALRRSPGEPAWNSITAHQGPDSRLREGHPAQPRRRDRPLEPVADSTRPGPRWPRRSPRASRPIVRRHPRGATLDAAHAAGRADRRRADGHEQRLVSVRRDGRRRRLEDRASRSCG